MRVEPLLALELAIRLLLALGLLERGELALGQHTSNGNQHPRGAMTASPSATRAQQPSLQYQVRSMTIVIAGWCTCQHQGQPSAFAALAKPTMLNGDQCP